MWLQIRSNGIRCLMDSCWRQWVLLPVFSTKFRSNRKENIFRVDGNFSVGTKPKKQCVQQQTIPQRHTFMLNGMVAWQGIELRIFLNILLLNDNYYGFHGCSLTFERFERDVIATSFKRHRMPFEKLLTGGLPVFVIKFRFKAHCYLITSYCKKKVNNEKVVEF